MDEKKFAERVKEARTREAMNHNEVLIGLSVMDRRVRNTETMRKLYDQKSREFEAAAKRADL